MWCGGGSDSGWCSWTFINLFIKRSSKLPNQIQKCFRIQKHQNLITVRKSLRNLRIKRYYYKEVLIIILIIINTYGLWPMANAALFFHRSNKDCAKRYAKQSFQIAIYFEFLFQQLIHNWRIINNNNKNRNCRYWTVAHETVPLCIYE